MPLGKIFFVLAVLAAIVPVHGFLQDREIMQQPPEPVPMTEFTLTIPGLKGEDGRKTYDSASDHAVWGLPEPVPDKTEKDEDGEKDPAESDAEKGYAYVVREFGEVQGIFLEGKQKDRWELYAVAWTGRIGWADFFNPSRKEGTTKGWKRLALGKTLDWDLKLKAVDNSRVVLSSQSGSQDYSLKLFRVGKLIREK